MLQPSNLRCSLHQPDSERQLQDTQFSRVDYTPYLDQSLCSLERRSDYSGDAARNLPQLLSHLGHQYGHQRPSKAHGLSLPHFVPRLNNSNNHQQYFQLKENLEARARHLEQDHLEQRVPRSYERSVHYSTEHGHHFTHVPAFEVLHVECNLRQSTLVHPCSCYDVSCTRAVATTFNKASFEVEDEREFFSAASSESPQVLFKLRGCAAVLQNRCHPSNCEGGRCCWSPSARLRFPMDRLRFEDFRLKIKAAFEPLLFFVFFSLTMPGATAPTVACLRNACQVSSFEVEQNSWACRPGYYLADEPVIDVKPPFKNLGNDGRYAKERIKRFLHKSQFANVEGASLPGRYRRDVSWNEEIRSSRDAASNEKSSFSTRRPSKNRKFGVNDFDEYTSLDRAHFPQATPFRSAAFKNPDLETRRRSGKRRPTSEYGERYLVTDEDLRNPDLTPWAAADVTSNSRASPNQFPASLDAGRTSNSRSPDRFLNSRIVGHAEADILGSNPRYSGRIPNTGGVEGTFINRHPESRVSRMISLKEVSCKPSGVQLSSVDQVCPEQLSGFAEVVRKIDLSGNSIAVVKKDDFLPYSCLRKLIIKCFLDKTYSSTPYIIPSITAASTLVLWGEASSCLTILQYNRQIGLLASNFVSACRQFLIAMAVAYQRYRAPKRPAQSSPLVMALASDHASS
ncbi:hypothetical protein FHG87_019637 [Trinorchestia longiramus]|nr:hypothetical protein FHG87_019637 [Trinorchestia longiramus]